MTDQDLKRLRRGDLLELLLAQSRENEELKKELEETRAKLADRQIVIDESGSLAEAALKLNGVFEAAQKAADQYLENMRLRAEADNSNVSKEGESLIEKVNEEPLSVSAAELQAAQLLEEAQSKCDLMEIKAKQ